MRIHLRFIRNAGFISRAIQWQSWGPGGAWSHVDFVLPEGYLGSQAPDGVRLRPYNYCTPSAALHCYVDLPDAAGNAILNWARAQIGKPYDYYSLLGIVMRRDWQRPDAWFCSEYVAAAFLKGNWPLLRTNQVSRISPPTLSLSTKLIG